MNEYETEEQQVEALKKWWQENRSSLIVGVLIGVSGLFGWRYYSEQDQLHALQASNLYMEAMQVTALTGIDDNVLDINNKLINDYSDTPYAALSSLVLAKAEYESGNVDVAATQLELAVKKASDDDIKQIAILRLTSVYIEQKKYDEASALLTTSHDSAYDARYEELNGDLFTAKGDVAQARIAYDKAIGLYGAAASKMLKLKRQNLGSDADNSAATESSLSSAESASFSSRSQA